MVKACGVSSLVDDFKDAVVEVGDICGQMARGSPGDEGLKMGFN